MTADPSPAEVRKLERLADLLDSCFRIPGTDFRFGIDPLIGLIPGLGDGASAVPALYIVMRAHQLGVPKRLIARMLVNVGLDLLAGAVPLLGDFFDASFKANRRNLALIKSHLAEHAGGRSA